jgi:hypothetical protein
MRTSCRLYRKYGTVVLFCLVSAALIFAGVSFLQPRAAEAKITVGTVLPAEDVMPLNKDNPRVQAAMELRGRHHHALMAMPDVIGTAVGLTDDQRLAVVVLTRKRAAMGLIPEELDGTPVVELVTGDIVAMPSAKRLQAVNPAGLFPRPVPIGVSTGNEGECSAGTISARVKDSSGHVYALSNNHVYALENGADIDSRVLQPGLYDTGCRLNTSNVIGTLSNFVQISFAGGTTNTVDAAIAASSIALLGNATPSNGYGMPNRITATASIGKAVQKYGRTTALTTGVIQAINATVNVGYSSGTATFVNQIVVTSRRAFIKAGDSGSLLVTNDSNLYPVGLLFAGNGSGTYAIANPINSVLTSLGVTIDGR